MKTFIRSMRILNAGFLLGAAFIMWLYKDEIESNKKKSDPYDFSNYKHNHTNKETVNA